MTTGRHEPEDSLEMCRAFSLRLVSGFVIGSGSCGCLSLVIIFCFVCESSSAGPIHGLSGCHSLAAILTLAQETPVPLPRPQQQP
jgi:hypothetical protein